MATLRIDPDAALNGSGTFASPYNTPPSASDTNTYLFKEGSKTALALNWILGRTDVILGTYDAETGDQIVNKDRQATVTIVVTNTGTVPTVNVGNTTRCKIQSLEIINEAPNATNRMGIYSSAATTDLEVSDCRIHYMRGVTGTHNGLQLVGSANTRPVIVRNECWDVGEDAYYIGPASDLTFEDNEASGVSLDGALGDCLQITGACPNLKVRRNKLDHRGATPGKQALICSSMSSTGGEITDNELYGGDSNTTVLFIEQASANVLRNKILGGSQGVELQGDSTVFSGNIVIASDSHPSDYIGVRLSSGAGIQVHKNTILSNSPQTDSYGIRQVSGSASFASNNIVSGFDIGVSGGSLTDSFNWCYNNTTDGATPVGSDIPGFRADYMPLIDGIRSAGSLTGGTDFHGKNDGLTIGAVQYVAPRSLVSRSNTTRTTATRTVSYRRGGTA